MRFLKTIKIIQMKKSSLYIALAAIGGLLAGYLFFGNASGEPAGASHDHRTASQTEQVWTCSMHPQVMQPEPGDCPICGMDLIPAASGETGLRPGQFRMTKNALALADIQTTRVGASVSGDNTLKLSGTITANKKAVGTQASYFDGRIEELFVNYEGEEVRSGQKLATLYAPELVSAQQELLTAAGLKSTQPELYKAVRNKLKLWKLTEKQIAEIEKSGQVQEGFPLYATVSGTVSEIMVQAGDYIKKGEPLYRIADLGSVWAVFDAYENQVSLLKEGQSIDITAKAYPRVPFRAKISFINPVLNTTTRTVEVRAVLENPGGRLKPGMFVTADMGFKTADQQENMIIPESAVLWTGERSVVYVKSDTDPPIFEMREIEVGEVINEGYIVLSGLQSGEEIVTRGTFTVDAAAQLKGEKSMMNDSGSPKKTGYGENPDASPERSAQGQLMQGERDFSKTIKKDIAKTIPAYLKMKDALVGGNAASARTEALAMAANLSEIRGSKGSAQEPHLNTLISTLETIGNSTSLETQREYFVSLNELLIPIMAVSGSAAQALYVQTCPMANNSKGAEWLSAEKEIRNPYYGDAMLQCGRVIDTIQ